MDYERYWDDTVKQRAERMGAYFAENAEVYWPCTNERFTVREFIRANCAYPGKWNGEVERVIALDQGAVTVVRVYAEDGPVSCHVTSFFTLEHDRITALTEYYADDGPPPQWRQEMHIGKPMY